MALPQSATLYTVEEYLALERAADERHEYLDGCVYTMAYESIAHGDIDMNLCGIIGAQLRGTPCRGRIANTKVRSGPLPLAPRSQKGLFSYPDFFIICGELQFHDKFRDVVINPTVIFEVLSESTEEFDRDEKFRRYDEWNPTLQDYLLVAQTAPKIEHFTRQPDGSWKYRVYHGLTASFTIEAVNCQLNLNDIYERVVFPPPKIELRAIPPKQKTVKRRAAAAAKRSKK